MRVIDINKWFLRLLPAVIAFSIGCVGGVLWATDKAYDTGYKMATIEMQRLLKEGFEGNTDFYIQGMPYLFRPQKDRKALQVLPKKKKTLAEM